MKSCSRKILELFYNAKHSGRVTKPDAVGRVGHDDDGLVIELTWRVVDGVIKEAKFRAFANPNAIAITSLMTDNIIGKSVEDAILINEDVIINNLDEFKPEYLEAYDMVRTAINDAYNNYLKRQSRKENAGSVEQVQHVVQTQEEVEIDVTGQIQSEIQTQLSISERRGRGRPRKEKPEIEQVEIGEKRGRGRPRKERPEGEIEEVVGEKRGRGRPRKEVDESLVQEQGEKRGRGRPKKVVDEAETVEVGEKRGRGRPRKERPEGEVEQVVGEKRGRGRPRKEKPETEQVEIGEKRGRGRPRKEVDESQVKEPSVKRGRGRPKKEVKYNFPSDLDDVINDEEVEQLINGKPSLDNDETKADELKTFVEDLISNKSVEEDVDVFDADYDVFKSNIRNILAGKEVASSYTENASFAEDVAVDEAKEAEIEDTDIPTENEQPIQEVEVAEEKRGRGRPRKVVDESQVEVVGEKRGRGRPRKIVEENQEVEDAEKRGRGRPKKIVVETVEDPDAERRGRGRPRLTPVNSLTRSLTNKGMGGLHNTQDIVFASKNVTTTNININVTKTTNNNDENQTVSDYSKNVNITSVQENSTITAPASVVEDKDEEIEVAPVENNTQEIEVTQTENVVDAPKPMFADVEDDFDDDIVDEEMEDEEEIDDSHIKDEAPTGGIADLLKALLDE